VIGRCCGVMTSLPVDKRRIREICNHHLTLWFVYKLSVCGCKWCGATTNTVVYGACLIKD
jgi:hypothetical protein